MSTSGKVVTQRILRARNAIRRKYRELKRNFPKDFAATLSKPTHVSLHGQTVPRAVQTSQSHSVAIQTGEMNKEGDEEKEETDENEEQDEDEEVVEEEEEEEEVDEEDGTPRKLGRVTFLPTEMVAETPTSSKTPLEHFVSTPANVKKLQSFLRDQFGELVEPYLKRLFTSKQYTDTTYGVRYENQKFYIGDAPIDITKTHIVVKGVNYKTTSGLLELLFSRTPYSDEYTDADFQKYKSIVLATNAHRRGYNAKSVVNATKSYKYNKIIAKMLLSRSARGLEFQPLLPSIDVKYWNNPNMLVERLQLLKASEQAGHTGHAAEILEIEEELRNAGIIV